MNQTVAQHVRSQRERLGWTVTALAGRAGITKSYLSMLENGRLSNPPSRDALHRLERALGVEADSLTRLAAIERMPGPVRREIEGLADAAERGRALAQWLQSETKSGPAPSGAGQDGPAADATAPTVLDRLYQSGELQRRVAEALGDDPPPPRPEDPPPQDPDAPDTSDGSEPARGPSANGNPIGGVAELVRTRAVPLINRVAAGYPTGFTDLDYPARVADETVSCPGLSDPDAFAARVCGESMRPDYGPGDIVVFSPLADVTDGCDCFVRLEPDHETTFKRVYFEADDRIRLQPLNPSFAPRTVNRLEVAGLYKAVWCMKPLS